MLARKGIYRQEPVVLGFGKPDASPGALLQEGKQGTLIRFSDIGEIIADKLMNANPELCPAKTN